MKKRSIKKSFVTIIALVLIGALGITNNWFGIFNRNTTYAAGDLNITWDGVPDGDPIFVVENMLPGDTENRDVFVTNAGSVARDVAVIGVKTEEINEFADILDFVITADGNPIYGTGSPTNSKTLEDFFIDAASPSGLFLTTIPNGETDTYNFKATFPPESGNEYQGAKVVFDLIIGIVSDIPAECNLINFTGPTIYGSSGNDNIQGTSKSELIITFEGKDKVIAGGGHDCIITNEGNDQVDGQTGNDVISTGSGDDKVGPSGGTDLIFTGEGNDWVDGGSNNDRIFGESGDDKLEGGSNDDEIYGGDGNDKILGGSGNDKGYGENNNDELFGGSGGDLLIGGPGTDKATGNTGSDTCDAETEITCEL